MSSRRALVTGGAGFIGSHLVEVLVHTGWTVRVLDDLSSGREEHLERVRDEVELIRGDVRDPAIVARAVAGSEVVFHHAAVPSAARSVAEPLHTNSVNIDGTLRVLDASREAGVRRLIYAASASCYGNTPVSPKVEAMPPEPRTPYALQKYAGEVYCRLYTQLHGLETVALRYFNVYGPRQDPTGGYAAAIPRFVTACLTGAAPRVYGDGLQTRDLVYVADAVGANLLAIDAPKAAGAVCNVGSGRATRVLELLDEIRRQTGSRVAPIHEPPREGELRDSLASLARARELLGYEPAVGLAEGLAATIASFEKQATRGTRP